MKKKLIVAMILVMAFAGSSLAAPGWGGPGKCGPGKGTPKGYGHHAWQNVPSEVRAKMDERAKLRIDLNAELRKDIPNKANARDIYGKISKLDREIETARFEAMIKDPARFNAPARGPRREISSEEKATFEELRKLHGDMRSEFLKETPDKAKLLELHRKIQSIKEKREGIRFEEMLKNPEAFRDARGHGGDCHGYSPAR